MSQWLTHATFHDKRYGLATAHAYYFSIILNWQRYCLALSLVLYSAFMQSFGHVYHDALFVLSTITATEMFLNKNFDRQGNLKD